MMDMNKQIITLLTEGKSATDIANRLELPISQVTNIIIEQSKVGYNKGVFYGSNDD